MPPRNRDHRHVPYRPSRIEDRADEVGGSLFWRFTREYLLPHRWSIALCVALMSLNASSVYLMSYYARVVVDDILVVEPGGTASAATANEVGRERIAASDHAGPRGAARPRHGAAHEEARHAVASRRPAGAGALLAVIFGLYTCTILVLNVSARATQRKRVVVGTAIVGQLRESLHRKVMDLSRSYHEMHTPGQLMSRILSDVGIVQKHLTGTVLDAGSHVVTFLIGVALLVHIEWRIALIALAAMPPYALAYRYAAKRIKPLNRELRHTNACLFGLVTQKIDAIKAVLGYNRQKHEERNFFRLNASLMRDSLQQQRLNEGMNRSTAIVTGLTTATIFLFGVRLVGTGDMTLGEMMNAYGIAANLFQPVLGLTRMTLVYSQLVVVLQRLVQVLDEPLEMADAPEAVPFPAPLRKGIFVQRLTFGYGGGEEKVLDGVSLEVPVGTWLCVMGPSGSGKSTLLGLLARLYDANAGEILFDGVGIAQIQSRSLRRRLALAPQEAEVFSGTIRDNIAYGHPDAQPREIMAAARAAEIHDFIMGLPVKYETTVGEKGVTLSGGQRQRIALARALLTNPEVLLLDDCTSSLDAETERTIQETLARLLKGKTAVIVSHRVSMAMRCHRICVLEDGALSEIGSHDKLLARNGYYARLYRQQTN
jgi:ABC-type multidrug transport system fused ATPase/permease subunit